MRKINRHIFCYLCFSDITSVPILILAWDSLFLYINYELCTFARQHTMTFLH